MDAYGGYYPNKIVKIAVPQQATIANANYSIDMPTTQPEYDEYYYDPRTMNYTKIENPHEIDRLKKELEKQKKDKELKLKNIIGYYYKR